ncbi:protein YcgK [Escherichia coli KTE43]|nr:protein YcgK [Escherichia coli KTE43]
MKIKGISKAVLLLALLTSTSFAAGKNVNVEFRKGHSSAQYSGEIKGYDYDTYTFYAKKGQKVHVSISNEGADTYLFGPGIDDSVDLSRYSPELDSHGQYSLPASGKYELRVRKPETTPVKTKLKNITSIFKLSKYQPTGTLPVINVNAPLLSVA